jgi:hypothetical protein
VWVTAQVPTNSGKRDLRDHLLPELVEIASWGSAGVTEDDFALVRSHFVLIGGLILPHPAEGDPGATALLDINLLCKGIAADLRVPSEEVHCYRNGTVSASPPVIDPEAARDARDAEDYEATAAYEHALETRALAETVVNASRVVSAWTDPAADAAAVAAATSPDEPVGGGRADRRVRAVHRDRRRRQARRGVGTPTSRATATTPSTSGPSRRRRRRWRARWWCSS